MKTGPKEFFPLIVIFFFFVFSDRYIWWLQEKESQGRSGTWNWTKTVSETIFEGLVPTRGCLLTSCGFRPVHPYLPPFSGHLEFRGVSRVSLWGPLLPKNQLSFDYRLGFRGCYWFSVSGLALFLSGDGVLDVVGRVLWGGVDVIWVLRSEGI